MPPILLRRSRSHLLLVSGGLILIFLLCQIIARGNVLRDTFSYATRPLWDHNEAPNQLIPHYHGEGLKINAQTCKLHGWDERTDYSTLKVLDAMLVNNELELLEIRMHELDDVVDYFLIVESNATFTGRPKEVFFARNKERFARFAHKIMYKFLPGYPLQPGDSPWTVEGNTRRAVSGLIIDTIATFPAGTPTLVLMSDVDEILAQHTIKLLGRCDFGSTLHLQLRDFLYSFEWFIGFTSWRASAHIWGPDKYYGHGKRTETILADAGWHCSFCFRTIGEYAIKMQGYSHADRMAGRLNLLDPQRLQDVICSGKDIFGMLPEAYSYLDFFSQLSLKPMKSAVGLPRYLIENAERLAFLLPGGCRREA